MLVCSNSTGYFACGNGLWTGLLSFAQYRFAGWPLHPVGLAIALTNTVAIDWFGIFLAWLVKLVALRYGGIHLYRLLLPFFIGLILGYFTAIGLSFFIDMIWFPGQGHPLYGN